MALFPIVARCANSAGAYDSYFGGDQRNPSTFSGVALLLAAVGIYSVLAYTVRRRVREIGIRMALGAQTSDVVGMVISEGMKPTFIGLAIGAAGALAVGRFVSSLIYGVKPGDI